MGVRQYGSANMKNDDLKGRDATGQLPPEEISDDEKARRMAEKASLLNEMATRTGVKIAGPAAKPHVKDQNSTAPASRKRRSRKRPSAPASRSLRKS
jgi:hypothetical protein